MAEEVVRTFIQGEGYGSIAPPTPDEMKSEMILFGNTTFIVTGVALREGKVLMMQEAKASCRGRWYLPAGRMEKGESIEDAVKREVAEETGLEFKPKSLICVEVMGLWIRYTLIGDVVGGELKTEEQADKESLQAGWYTSDTAELKSLLPLRASDILPLINCAVKWTEREKKGLAYQRLPVVVPQHGPSIGIVAVCREGPSLKLLRPRAASTPIPVHTFNRVDFDSRPLSVIVEKTLADEGVNGKCEVLGFLSVQHNGRTGKDGVHFDLLVDVGEPNTGGNWTTLSEGEESKWLLDRMDKKSGCIELMKFR